MYGSYLKSSGAPGSSNFSGHPPGPKDGPPAAQEGKESLMTSRVSRRRFLGTGLAAAAGPLLLPRSVRGANEKLNLAGIGVDLPGPHGG